MFFMENDNDIGSPVNVFMKAFLDEVETALTEQEYQSCPEKESHIKIELHATGIKEAGGGLKIHVFNLGGKLSDSNTQKMTVYAKKISEVDKAEEEARIKLAKHKMGIIDDEMIKT